jgi:UPF0755 protein
MLKRFLIAITFVVVSALAWYFQSMQPVVRFDVAPVDFEIKPNTGLSAITDSLSAAKLIRSRTAFKITVVRLGLTEKMQAGFFKLSPNMTASEIALALTHASVRQVRVTIQEGLRSEEINLILNKAFQNVLDKKYDSKEFEVFTKNREGYLFPDTYDFSLTANAQTISERLFARFDEVSKSLGLNITSSITDSKSDRLVTIASLLEREAANASEMPLVAGVIVKRLENDWPLQIDATVQYALASKNCKKIDCAWWSNNLTSENIKFPSPFNTYLNKGLPPTPISNPGKDALAAAANPQASSAWFYLHDLDGKIHFADSIEGHNKNICLYLKKDCK